MSRVKKLLAYVLAFAMVISCFAGIELTAKAEGENVLSVGQTFDVEPTDGIQAIYQFTPDEDGAYTLYSYNLNTGYVNLSSTENWLSNSWWEGNVIVLSYDLKAGETYTYSIVNDDNEAASFNFVKAEKATEIGFAEDTIEGWVGDYLDFEIKFGPMFCIPESYGFTSDNEEVVFVDENGDVKCVGAGTATVTVTSESGLTDTCTVISKEPATIEEGVVTTVENPKRDASVLYYFTPSESGLYAFYSDANDDVMGYVFDMDGNCLAEDDDSGEDVNFVVKVELEEGVTYLLESYLYPNASEKPYDIIIKKLTQATEMSFNYNKMITYVGKVLDNEVVFGPGVVLEEDFELSVGNADIISVSRWEDSNWIEIQALNVGETTLTATSTNGLTCTCAVVIKEPESIVLDDAKTVVPEEGQELVQFIFTPDDTDEYVFYSTDGNDAGVEVTCDSSGFVAGDSGSGSGDNFKVATELQEGQTYRFTCYLSEDADCVSVMLKKATEATAIAFEYSEMTLYVDNYVKLNVNVEPENGVTNINYTSSNERVVRVDDTGSVVTWIEALSEGTATITATSSEGLTATCTITVIPPEDIELNVTETVDIEETYQTMLYVFTPETDGNYVIMTKDATEPVAVLISDEEYSFYDYYAGSEAEPNVSETVELEAGVTYIIMTGYDMGDTVGTYKLTIYDEANVPVDTPDDTTDTDNSTSDDATNNDTTGGNTTSSSTTAPKTGDSNVTWIWVVLMMAALLGAFVVVIERKKNR